MPGILLDDLGVQSFRENGFAVLTGAFAADELAAEIADVFGDAFGGDAGGEVVQPAEYADGGDGPGAGADADGWLGLGCMLEPEEEPLDQSTVTRPGCDGSMCSEIMPRR